MSMTAALTLAATVSTSAFAHSHLGETSPADGETVVEPLQEITLNFDGNIEQGSYIDVISSTGETIEADISISPGVLTGTFSEALPNDTYTVDWSIISADGHPLEGEYSFTVNAPVVEEPVEEAAVTEEENDTATEVDTEEATDTADTTEASTDEEGDVTGPSGAMLAAVGIGVLALLGGVFYFVMRKE